MVATTTTRVFFPYAISFGAVISILSYSFTWINSYLGEEEEEDNNKYYYYLIYLFGIIIAAVIVCVYNILRYVWNVSKLQFPGPTPFPLLGNTLSLQDKGNFQESIRSLVATYGNVVDIIVLDGERILLVNDPSFCKIVMKSMDRGDLIYFHLDNNKKASVGATTSSSWFRLPQILWNHRRYREKLVWQELRGYSNELDLFSRSDKYGDWKDHRRLLQPAFDQKHVRAMGRKIQQSVDTLVSNIPINNNNNNNNMVVDIMPYLLDYGLDMIHSTTLAKQLSDLPDRGQFVVRFLTNASQLFNMYMFHPFPYFSSHILPYFGLNNREIQRRRELPAFRQYCRNLIEMEQQRQQQQQKQQRPARNEASTTTSEGGEDSGVGQDNLLSLMVARLGDEFDVENAVDELIAFLFAGFDTTSTTLGNLIYDLTTNPSAQQKVHEELDDAFANNPPSSSYDDIVQNHLPYLSACIRESQRLQPVAPMLFRRLHQDVRLQYNKDENNDGGTTQKKETIVAKGTTVLVPIFLLHRDEKQYPDPETFRPERWLRRDDDDSKNPHPNSGGGSLRLIPPTPGYYYAFGGGPKMCVGYQLGEKEVKMAAAGIFKSFEVTRCGERVIVDSFTTGPEKILCKLQPRKMTTSR